MAEFARDPVDAVVLLGCRIEPSGQPGAAAARRARVAAATLDRTGARWIVASGGRRWFGHAEASALAHALQDLGVPSERIVQELCSLSTFENARYASKTLSQLNVARAAIVTCDWHLPRALRCFEYFGASVIGVPAVSPQPPAWSRLLRERISFALDRVATLGLEQDR